MALPVFGGRLFGLIRLFGVPLSICGYKEFQLRATVANPLLPMADAGESDPSTQTEEAA